MLLREILVFRILQSSAKRIVMNFKKMYFVALIKVSISSISIDISINKILTIPILYWTHLMLT